MHIFIKPKSVWAQISCFGVNKILEKTVFDTFPISMISKSSAYQDQISVSNMFTDVKIYSKKYLKT